MKTISKPIKIDTVKEKNQEQYFTFSYKYSKEFDYEIEKRISNRNKFFKIMNDKNEQNKTRHLARIEFFKYSNEYPVYSMYKNTYFIRKLR